MKIGIFGGTFDPFTKSHAQIVQSALNSLDKIIIVPTTVSYYRGDKCPLFSFKDRCEIIQSAIDRCWRNEKVEISTIEEEQLDTWSAADTIKYMKEQYPDNTLYFIMGSDSFDTLDTWRNSEYLKENVKFIVVNGRNGKFTKNQFPHFTIYIPRNFESASSVRSTLLQRLKEEYIGWAYYGFSDALNEHPFKENKI